MDPLSVSASVVALIQLTGTLISYLNDVKEASKDRAKLAVEASNLYSSLISLRFRVEDSNIDDPWFVGIRSLGAENGPLDQFKSELEDLAGKSTPLGGLKRLTEKFTWTFETKDVAALLSRMERLKSFISLALDNDLFKLSLAVKGDLSDVRSTVSRIQDKLGDVEVKQDDSRKRSLNAEQVRIAKWMSPLDFLSTRNDVLSKRQPGTGQWFLGSRQFKDWMGKEGATTTSTSTPPRERRSELWCPGIPGAGKTTLRWVSNISCAGFTVVYH